MTTKTPTSLETLEHVLDFNRRQLDEARTVITARLGIDAEIRSYDVEDLWRYQEEVRVWGQVLFLATNRDMTPDEAIAATKADFRERLLFAGHASRSTSTVSNAQDDVVRDVWARFAREGAF